MLVETLWKVCGNLVECKYDIIHLKPIRYLIIALHLHFIQPKYMHIDLPRM